MSSLSQKLMAYSQLMRLHKPLPIGLLLWPTLWALWLANWGFPDPVILCIFLLGIVLMRSAGCVINDIADRKIDGHVQRTQQRPLVSGSVTIKEAWILFAVLCFLAFVLALFLNLYAFGLAFIALGLAILYPFMKRYTYFPQVFLGLAWYMGIPMAFAAEINQVPFTAWYLYIIAVLWAVVYDTYYAMVDKEYDIKIGVKSTAILFGQADRLIIGILQTVIVALLLLLGLAAHFSWIYYLCIILASISFIYQQWITRTRDPKHCLKAFLNNNYFGAIVFIGLILSL